ncbi:MAG TPA: DUF1015 domain-containing protein [Acidimicrobiales bacterium]|nr:DUF1015 domain-containing protein [Acidimicrobiales bacterium]
MATSSHDLGRGPSGGGGRAGCPGGGAVGAVGPAVVCYARPVPRFEPFTGLRYRLDVLNRHDMSLDDVIAPPYDVIDARERETLARRSPYNAVHVELPVDDPDRRLDRYQVARRLLDTWRSEDVIEEDVEPSLYRYRMSYRDEHGGRRQTSGVIGALGLAVPGEGDVLPHERTMPKPKGDRLQLLRESEANLSPVWGLALARGLAQISETADPPIAAATDDEGVEHELWRISAPGAIEQISAAVTAAPVVIADGHHRFETALAYQEERRAATGGVPGDYDLVMALVVDLAEDQLVVRPIHRLLAGLPDGFDLPETLGSRFYLSHLDHPDPRRLTGDAADEAALALVTKGATWLLRPRPETVAAAGLDVDSGLLDVALSDLPDHDVTYEPGWDRAVDAVEHGSAQAAVLLRPATVAVIAEAAHRGLRMPPKTTFFHPKPRTGMVFRPVRG